MVLAQCWELEETNVNKPHLSSQMAHSRVEEREIIQLPMK